METKKPGAILRILLHAFFLISVNLFSIIGAFVFIQIFGNGSDKLIQSAVAMVINLLIYVAVFKLMNNIQKEIMEIDNLSMFIVTLLVSLALLPSVFYPMHYLTQGNWSTFDNILATWPYQLVVNGICLTLNYFMLSGSKLRQ